jgi:Type II secretion system (T2SS), protein E, N-terminal domain
MPFLARKTENRSVDGSIASALTTEGGLGFTRDIYMPSGGRVLGIESSVSGGSPHRRSCGNVECASTWTAPWRSRRRPIFEGQWGCSGRCVLAIVKAAINREMGEGEGEMASKPHRHRVPLGLVMLAQGWITHPQLRHALEAQRANGRGRIGDWLVAECGLETEQITRGLSMQWSCPVLSSKGFEPEAMALAVPRAFVDEFSVLPLRVAGQRILYLAFEEQLDASVALAMEQMSELKVESGLMESAQFKEARAKLMACAAVKTNPEGVTSMASLAARITAILEQRQPVAARLVRLRQYYWLRLWLESGAMSSRGSIPGTDEDMSDHIFTIGVIA